MLADETAEGDQDDRTTQADARPNDSSALLSWIPTLGTWTWTFVGFVIAAIIVIAALSAVSEIVLPLLFAAVLAIVFKPLVGSLIRHKFKPTLAAGTVVLGLIALMVVVAVATVRGVIEQTDQIGSSVDAAIDHAVDALDIDRATLDAARAAIQDMAPTIGSGFLTELVSGFGALVGIASGVILGALIMYYILKDGTRLRRAVVAQFDPRLRGDIDAFIGDTCRILRDYGRGRTAMSAIVAVVIGLASLLLGLPLVFTIVVVNFIGGYIPYIGAFLGGGLAVLIALGDGGLDKAAIMLVIVLAANLVLENFVEPKVMGRTLNIHPLVVLVVTALGGIVGGIVGLILAVPATVIAANAFTRLRSKGVIDHIADRGQAVMQGVVQHPPAGNDQNT